MRILDSVIIAAADACAVPAGGALAVDRHEFAARVTDIVKNHPNVTVVHEEVTEIPEGPRVIATGPLNESSLIGKLKELTWRKNIFTSMMRLHRLLKKTALIWIKSI